jgi:peptidoglycan DL-endopeptidase CwlO
MPRPATATRLLIAAAVLAVVIPAGAVAAVLTVAIGDGDGAVPALVAAALAECAQQSTAQAASQPAASQPAASAKAGAIPSNYLTWYKKVGQQYNIPWTILAGIGTEESDNGQSTLPGVHSGANPFGAAGPMQIGIGGASTDTWATVATSEDGIEPPSVYDPADAIAGAAKYLNLHGYQQDPSAAIYAYNHAGWYVTAVENYAAQYAAGSYTVASPVTTQPATPAGCAPATAAPAKVAAVLAWAREQIGTLYQFGGSCAAAHSANMALHCDCSSLVQAAFRHGAGLSLPRTAAEQWQWGLDGHAKVIPVNQAQAGDVVYFPSYLGPDTIAHTGIITDPATMTMLAAPTTGERVGYYSYNPATLPYKTHLFTILRFIVTPGSHK